MAQPQTRDTEPEADTGTTKRLEVVILGQHLSLKGDRDAAHVRRLVQAINARIDQLRGQGILSSLKLAVLAALNFADELSQAEARNDNLRRDVAARSRQLLDELDALEVSHTQPASPSEPA